MRRLLALLCVLEAESFRALLVAGSRGIENYRHQADLCHSYDLLVDVLSGNASHITTMMVDDVAWHVANPIPGKLFNQPGGPDVYRNCRLNITGEQVNAPSFLNALSHQEGETLFVSFVDHGSFGKLLFPRDFADSQNLISSLETLNSFRLIVVYVEACFAGSLFEGRELPGNVLAVTASNATESSWATFCPTELHPDADLVNGLHIGTCLGDLFSVLWMMDLAGTASSATLGSHIDWVRNTVAAKSHVMVYGNLTFLDEFLFDFFPAKKSSSWFPHWLSAGSPDNVLDIILSSAKPNIAQLPEIQQYTLL